MAEIDDLLDGLESELDTGAPAPVSTPLVQDAQTEPEDPQGFLDNYLDTMKTFATPVTSQIEGTRQLMQFGAGGAQMIPQAPEVGTLISEGAEQATMMDAVAAPTDAPAFGPVTPAGLAMGELVRGIAEEKDMLDEEGYYKGYSPEDVYKSPQYQESLQAFDEALRTIEKAKPEGTAAGMGYDSIGSLMRVAPSLAVTAATKSPNLGLATMFPTVYAEQFGHYAMNPLVKPEDIGTHAAAAASIETLTEKIPLEMLVKTLKWDGVKSLLQYGIAEPLQEGISGFLQSEYERGAIDPNMTLSDSIDAFQQQAIMGLVGVPTTVGTAAAFGYGAEKAKGAIDAQVLKWDRKRALKIVEQEIETLNATLEEKQRLRDGFDKMLMDISQGRELSVEDVLLVNQAKDIVAQSEMEEFGGDLQPAFTDLRNEMEALQSAETLDDFMTIWQSGRNPWFRNIVDFYETPDEKQAHDKIVDENTQLPLKELAPNTVALVTNQFGADLVKSRQTNLNLAEQVVAEAQAAFDNGQVGDLDAVAEAESNRDKAALQLQRAKRLVNVTNQVRTIAPMLQDILNQFGMKGSIILSDGSYSKQFKKNGSKADQTFDREVDFDQEYSHVGGHVFRSGDNWVIEINPYHYTKMAGREAKESIIDSVFHEFGHALLTETFINAPPHIQKALIGEWRDFLDKTDIHETMSDFAKRYYSKPLARYYMGLKKTSAMTLDEVMQRGLGRDVGYKYEKLTDTRYRHNFQEFLAQSMARQLETYKQSDLPSDVKAYLGTALTKSLGALKSKYTEATGRDQTMGTLLDLLQTDKAVLDTMQLIKEKQVERDLIADPNAGLESTLAILDKVGKLPPVPGAPGVMEFDPKDVQKKLTKYSSIMKYGYTITQVARLNPHVQALQQYVEEARNWWVTKMKWMTNAEGVVRDWSGLGPARADRLGLFALDLTVLSDQKQKQFTLEDQEFQDLVKKYKIDDEMLEVYGKISGYFQKAVGELEEILIADAQEQFVDNPVMLENKIGEITAEMQQLRDRNYFPLPRFGQYTVVQIAQEKFVEDGITYKPGDTYSFELYESAKEAKKRYKQVRGQKRVRAELPGKIPDEVASLAGTPRQLMTSMLGKLRKEGVEFDEDQQALINQMMFEFSPAQSFKKHLLHRKGTKGFSGDALRGFAQYAQSFSGNIARMKWRGAMSASIKGVKAYAKDVKRVAEVEVGEGIRLGEIVDYMEDHLGYIMNPGNEWASLRAFAFMWHLGFMVKSAVVNLTQVPMITLPWLSERYGEPKAAAALVKAVSKATASVAKPNILSADEQAVIDQLIEEGILDESLATEVAAIGEGQKLSKMLYAMATSTQVRKAEMLVREFAGKGAAMFQLAEKANRRVTALAAYNLAKGEGLPHNEAVRKARDAVEMTQYEYAYWDRPRFMRGKTSTMFVFWMYLQKTLFLTAHDPARVRIMMMILLMAGLAGLPGSEDLMDLYDFVVNQFKRILGKGDPNTNVRRDMRQFIAELDANPDLVMHGASRYGFGLPMLGDVAGVPIPNFDLSGSLSLGRVVPGIEPLFGQQGDFDDRLMRASEDVAGAVWTIPVGMMRAVVDDDPDWTKRVEKAVPNAMKNVMKGSRWWHNEAETLPSGARITEFDLNNPLHRVEIAGQMLGFVPTRVSTAKEAYYMKQDMARFYEQQKRILLDRLDYAIRKEDSEGRKAAIEDIMEYNRRVPYAAQKINAQGIERSMVKRAKDRAMTEAGYPQGKKLYEIDKEIDQLFPNL